MSLDMEPYVLPDGTRLSSDELVSLDDETYRSARFSPREGAYLAEQARMSNRLEEES